MNFEAWLTWPLLAAYLLLLGEWGLLAVGSEVSARQLLRRGQRAGDPLAAIRDTAWSGRMLRFGLPTALGLFVGVVPLVALLAPLPGQLPASPWLAVGGLLLAFASRLWSFSAAMELRRVRGALASGGPFRWSRHPILLGMHAFCLGAGLVLPNVIQLAGLAVWIALMHRRVRLEEAALLQRHGDAYRAYMAQVACYVGRRPRAA